MRIPPLFQHNKGPEKEEILVSAALPPISVVATLTDKGLSLVIDGNPAVVSRDHINYEKIIEALRARDYEAIPALLDVAKSIGTITEGLVTVENGVVYHKGAALHNSLTTRMLEMLRLGLDITPLAKFLSNLMQNPSFRSVNELFNFMEACDLPITEDGRLLAYKSVNEDYMDTHTGKTFNNKPGNVIKVERNQVDDNPECTCSYGLHVCSQKYGMYGRRLLLVAVNPRDVVSVPNDYNNAKMRVSEYEVLKDVQDQGFRTWDDTPVYSQEDEEEICDEDYWNALEEDDDTDGF